MSAAAFPLFVAPRPWRFVGRLAVSMLIPTALLALGFVRANPAASLLLLLFAVAQVALALALSHKEVLAASFSFVQPGLRRRVAATQAVWCLAAGAVAAGAAVLLGLVPTVPVAVAGFLASAVAVYAIFALVAFQLAWSFQIPAWSFYVFLAVPLLNRAGATDAVVAALTRPLPWTLVAVPALVVLVWTLRSPGLHRRVCGSVVLAPEDIVRPSRVQALKAARVRHRPTGADAGWRAALLRRCCGRLAAATAQGRFVAARIWALLHGGFAQSFPRSRWAAVLLPLGIVLLGVGGGYYDSRVGGAELVGWFGGLAFAAAAAPATVLAMAVTSAAAVPCSRRTGVLAELLVAALAVAGSVLLGLALMGVFQMFAAVLPDLTVAGRTYAFQLPRPHVLLLPPVVSLGLWFVVAMRPRSGSAWPAVASFEVFLIGHALMTFLPYRTSLPIWIGVGLLAGAVAGWRRRRWWAVGDRVG